MRRPGASLLLFLLLACFSFPARAALQFDLHVGYEGKIHEASWFPIVCEVYNDGPSFNAVIEVWGGQFGKDQVREIPVELPTNARKRIVIPMFASGGRFGTGQWNGKLTGGSRKPEERVVQTSTVAWESTILGALPRNFGGSPIFPELKQNRPEMKPEVARFTADTFPDNPITLEGLNALYLNSEKAADLRVPQVTALLGWVRAGGHLIVAAEQVSDINSTPWLKQFLPMELTDGRNLRIDQEVLSYLRSRPGMAEETQPNRRGRTVRQPTGNAYQDVPEDGAFKDAEMFVTTGTTKEGYTLFSAENVPLAVQAPRGRGKVTLLAFSPEREPFRSWKAKNYFWAKLAGIPGEFFTTMENQGYGGLSIDGVFGALIDSRQIKKLPVTWLLLLLVVYLVVIGPFDQWWLKKIGKQMLTWITFPTYVVLFSLLIYFIGYKLRAGETEWNELNIVDVLPRCDKVDLRGRTYISIYSSSNARYPLNGQDGHATLRGELMDFRSGGREGSKARVVHQGNTFKAEVDVAVWTSSLYANEWFKTNDTPFVAAIAVKGNEYQVDIENLLDRPLTSVRVVVAGKMYDVGEVPANEKKTFNLAPEKGVLLSTFVQENAQYFQRAVELRSNPLGDTSGGHIEDRPLTATVASFISYLDSNQPQGRSFVYPPGIDLRKQVERGDSVVFAWVPGYSFSNKINDFQPPRFKQDTMLRLTIPVRSNNPI